MRYFVILFAIFALLLPSSARNGLTAEKLVAGY